MSNATTKTQSLAAQNIIDQSSAALVAGQNDESVKAAAEVEIEAQAAQLAQAMLDCTLKPRDSHVADAQEDIKTAVESMGREAQLRSATKTTLLAKRVKSLSSNAGDSGDVAKSLVDLKVTVSDLDPNKVDFSRSGVLSRLAGLIPGLGTPMKRYIAKYESSQSVIDQIVAALRNGQVTLTTDNVNLKQYQSDMRELCLSLEHMTAIGVLATKKITEGLAANDIPDEKRRFIEEELLFPLNQRVKDLQQQLAVNQQGIMAIETLRRNNKELMRSVDRAVEVTVSALSVAVVVSSALSTQKQVQDKITAVGDTTSALIAGTAKRLHVQGTEINRQASASMLNEESLKNAFKEYTAAMDEMANYRREALPQMAASIAEFERLTSDGEKTIKRLEIGSQQNPLTLLSAGPAK